ncbi:LANO_0G04786g1_1 [Lachancea nothofagi CBS 11611]|uniref:Oleate activated transcription factor 3 n=1 Tax=Lachancea nothofagi CBS 11611 TaxID=1266666 RepID=A0A1G4KGA3_9SACH|nr:LANO_0G04786g1_1 [Lachancea nothofagi CBS 11611]
MDEIENTTTDFIAKKRQRPTIVCTNCRRRKSKCDKARPACGTCVKAGIQESCCYVPDPRTQKKQKALPNGDEMIPYFESTYVDLVPLGFAINQKRSGTSYISPLSAAAARQRDPYLQILEFICMLPKCNRKISKKLVDGTSAEDLSMDTMATNGKAKSAADNLPRSMRHLKKMEQDSLDLESSLTSKHKNMCKHLFEKFGKSHRSDAWTENGNGLPREHMPNASIFFELVWPFYLKNISDLCPIFDTNALESKLRSLYKEGELSGTQSKEGIDDYACFSILLLITSLVQLSISFSKSINNPSAAIIENIESEHYISIVNHCTFRAKNNRKCSLLRVQSMLLLRFYQWCAPDDGDGERLQQSNMLMGAIVSACYSIGIGWHCFSNTGKLVADLTSSLSRPSQMEQTLNEYKRVWSVVINWDRKLSLLTGQSCLVGSTLRAFQESREEISSLHTLKYDHLMQKLASSVSENPRKVDYDFVRRLSGMLKNTIRNDPKKDESNKTLAFEIKIVIILLELSLDHARMVNCELNQDPEDFQECVQSLMEKVLKLTNFCEFHLCIRKDELFTRFYTNKIVDIAFEIVAAIVPSIILRAGRSGEPNLKKVLLEFYRNILTACFNELGTEYYQCFRRMFGSKVLFKTLSYLNEKDPWITILEYLALSDDKEDDPLEYNPLIIQKFWKLYQMKEKDKKVSDIWDACYTPNDSFSFELDVNNLEKYLPFTANTEIRDYDVFSAFFNNASSPFFEKVKELPSTHSVDLPHDTLNNFDYGLLTNDENLYDPLVFLDFFEPQA